MHQSVYRQGILKVKQVLKNKGTSVSLRCERIIFFSEEKLTVAFTEDKYFLITIKTTETKNFLPGDIIRVSGFLSEIKAPLNPNSFDAQVYYNTIGIRHQMYCKEEDLSVETTSNFSIARMTARWQATLSNLGRKHLSPQVAQLTNALVWGDRSDMDSEVRNAFAESGAMHVLSVSGMHVAIIYSMLLFILGPPGAGNFLTRLLRFSLYTLAIILYMGLTGACPAVIRAGLMIILYLFGKSMGWNTQVWNLLGFAAFVMLWINPFVWQNIGFQLSFLAMAGILLFAKPIIRSLTFKYRILHLTWEIVALSLAAQVFILPILLSQFHQFPITFIISSIVAIPAAYLVMFGALLSTLLSFIGFDFIWPALDYVGKLFIEVMHWMSGLNPEMHFSLPSSGNLALMLMAILFSVAIVFNWPFGKKIGWVCGCLTFLTLGCHRFNQWSSQDLTIYHSSKGMIIDIMKDGICYSILDCGIPPESIEFVTRGNRCEKDIIHVEPICKEEDFSKNEIKIGGSLIYFGPHKLAIWHQNEEHLSCVTQFSHVVIDECKDVDVLKDFLLTQCNIIVIIPAHLDRKLRKEIGIFLAEHTITFHDIDIQGYYKLQV